MQVSTRNQSLHPAFRNTSTPNANIIPSSEYDQIIRVVQQDYAAGLRKAKPSRIAQTFRRDAILPDYTLEGTLIDGPDSKLCNFTDRRARTTWLEVIGITPQTALVKVCMGDDYTDYHTVINYGGEWLVISRAYHAS